MAKCLKCGSEKIIEGKLAGLANLEIETKKVPWYKLKKENFALSTILCLECGFVEFSANIDEIKPKL